jgi:hypothetical protein
MVKWASLLSKALYYTQFGILFWVLPSGRLLPNLQGLDKDGNVTHGQTR